MRQSPLILLLITLLLPLLAQAKMYRWTDADGNTVYSQTPPPAGMPAQEIKPPPPPAEDPASARERLLQRQQSLEDQREDRQLKKEQQEKQQAENETRKANCQQARKNVTTYSGGARRMFRDKDGKVSLMDEKERAERLKTAREQVKKYCN